MSDDPPWTNLGFAEAQTPFQSPSQNARVWTEGWVAQSLFCPNCGAEKISRFPANRALADFECRSCQEQYELKAQRSRFGAKIMDGEYSTKLQRLRSADNPSLMVMRYDRGRMSVTDLIVVPKRGGAIGCGRRSPDVAARNPGTRGARGTEQFRPSTAVLRRFGAPLLPRLACSGSVRIGAFRAEI